MGLGRGFGLVGARVGDGIRVGVWVGVSVGLGVAVGAIVSVAVGCGVLVGWTSVAGGNSIVCIRGGCVAV